MPLSAGHFCAAVTLFLLAVSSVHAQQRKIGLILRDDFGDTSLDTSKWDKRGNVEPTFGGGEISLFTDSTLYTTSQYPAEFVPLTVTATLRRTGAKVAYVFVRTVQEDVAGSTTPSSGVFCSIKDTELACFSKGAQAGTVGCAEQVKADINPPADKKGTLIVIDDGFSVQAIWNSTSVTLQNCPVSAFPSNYIGVGGSEPIFYDSVEITGSILAAAPPPPPPPAFENCPFFCGPNGLPSANSRSCKCRCAAWAKDLPDSGFELPLSSGGYSGPECQNGKLTYQARFLLDDIFGETDRTGEVEFASEVRNRASWDVPRRARIEIKQPWVPHTFFLHTSRLTNKELTIELAKPSVFSGTRRFRKLDAPQFLGDLFDLPDYGDPEEDSWTDAPADNTTHMTGEHRFHSMQTPATPELDVYARWDLPPSIDVETQFVRPVVIMSSTLVTPTPDPDAEATEETDIVDVVRQANGMFLIKMQRADFSGAKLYFSIVPRGTFTLTDDGNFATPQRYELDIHFQDAVQFSVNLFLLAFWSGLILTVTVFRFAFPTWYKRCKIAVIGSHEEKEEFKQKLARKARAKDIMQDQAVDEALHLIVARKDWRKRYPHMTSFSDEQRLSTYMRSLKLCRGVPSAYLPDIGLPEPNLAKVANVLKNLLSHSMNITRVLLKKANANSTGFVEPVEYRRTRAVSDSDSEDWFRSAISGTTSGAKNVLQTLDISVSSASDDDDDEFLEDFDYASSLSTDDERNWAGAARDDSDEEADGGRQSAKPALSQIPELLRTRMKKRDHFILFGRSFRRGGEANELFTQLLHTYLEVFDVVMNNPSVQALQDLLKLAGQLRYQLKLCTRTLQKQLMIVSHRNKALLELSDHPLPEDDDPKYPYLIATRVSIAVESHAMNIMRTYQHSLRLKRLIWKSVLSMCQNPSLQQKGLSLLNKHNVDVIELTNTMNGQAEPYLAAQLGMDIPSEEFVYEQLSEEYSLFLADVASNLGRRAAAELADPILARHQGTFDEIITRQIRSLIKKLHEFHYRMSSENIARLLNFVTALEQPGGEEPGLLPFIERVLEDIKNNMFLNTKWYRIRPNLNRELVQDMEMIRRRLVRLVKVFGERKDALIRAAKKPPVDHERNVAVLDASINLLPLVTAANHIKDVLDKHMRVFRRVVENNEPTSAQRSMMDNMENLYMTFASMVGLPVLESLHSEIYAVMLPRVSSPASVVMSVSKGEEATYILPKFAKHHNTKDNPTVYSLFEEAWTKCICASPALHQVSRDLKLGLNLNPRVDLPDRAGKVEPPQGLLIVYQIVAVFGLVARATIGFLARAFLVLWDLALIHQSFLILPRFGIPVISQSELEVAFRSFLPNGPRGFYTKTQRIFANTMWRLDLMRYLERWNCGGIVLALSPIFIITGLSVIYLLIKGNLVFLATKHVIRLGTGKRRYVKVVVSGLAHIVSTLLLYIAQITVVSLTGFIFSSAYTLNRSCGDVDKIMLDFVRLPFLGVMILAAAVTIVPVVVGSAAHSPKSETVKKWACLRGLWGVWHGFQRLLMGLVGVWSDKMLLSHRVVENAMTLDDDPNDASNQHALALSVSARQTSLFWLLFPLGVLLTKLQDALNFPPLITICKRPAENPWRNEFPCFDAREDNRLVGPTVAALVRGDKQRRQEEHKKNQLRRQAARRARLGIDKQKGPDAADSLSEIELKDLEENNVSEEESEKAYDSVGYSECEYSVSDEEDQELLGVRPGKKDNASAGAASTDDTAINAYSRVPLDLQWGIFHRIPLVLGSLTILAGIIGLLMTADQTFIGIGLLGLLIESVAVLEWGIVSNWEYVMAMGSDEPPPRHLLRIQKKRLVRSHVEAHLHEHKPKGPPPADVLDYRDYLDEFQPTL